jgi:hypothetical protein
VHAVAIVRLSARLSNAIDAEAKALAADLGTIAYEQRLKLAGGMPAIVLTTPDPGRAAALAGAIRGRGHDVVVVDADHVVGVHDMVAPKGLRLDAAALVSTHGLGARVAWSDIAALIRAVYRTHAETTEVVVRKEFAAGRALLTGGLMTTKKVAHEVTTRSDDAEPVVFVFARNAGPPWWLRERALRYDALGAALTTSSTANFQLLIDALRTRATGAVFDDRLVARKLDNDSLELLVHIVASGASEQPFR